MELGKRFSSVLLSSALMLGGLGLAGCDDNVEVIHDPDIHIAKGMTWAWRPMNAPEPAAAKRPSNDRPVTSRDVITQPPPSSQRLENSNDWNTESNRAQLREAIERALKSKGLVQVNTPATADFLVDYHVAVRTQTATVQYVYPGGYGWGWGWGPPEVEYQNIRYHEGTFVLDLALRQPRKLAYRAISHKELNNKQKISPWQAEEAVNHLLKGLKPL